MNYTKGVWGIEFTRSEHKTSYHLNHLGKGKLSIEEAEANARLIQNAPELLKALKCAYANCSKNHMTPEAKYLIETTIAKAEG